MLVDFNIERMNKDTKSFYLPEIVHKPNSKLCLANAAWQANVHNGINTGGGNFFLKRFFFTVSSSAK